MIAVFPATTCVNGWEGCKNRSGEVRSSDQESAACDSSSVRSTRLPAYTRTMKITIEIPSELMSSADLLSKRLGISFDELLATAVSEFLERSRKSEVTKRLNEVYATESSSLDPVPAVLQYETHAKQFHPAGR